MEECDGDDEEPLFPLQLGDDDDEQPLFPVQLGDGDDEEPLFPLKLPSQDPNSKRCPTIPEGSAGSNDVFMEGAASAPSGSSTPPGQASSSHSNVRCASQPCAPVGMLGSLAVARDSNDSPTVQRQPQDGDVLSQASSEGLLHDMPLTLGEEDASSDGKLKSRTMPPTLPQDGEPGLLSTNSRYLDDEMTSSATLRLCQPRNMLASPTGSHSLGLSPQLAKRASQGNLSFSMQSFARLTAGSEASTPTGSQSLGLSPTAGKVNWRDRTPCSTPTVSRSLGLMCFAMPSRGSESTLQQGPPPDASTGTATFEVKYYGNETTVTVRWYPDRALACAGRFELDGPLEVLQECIAESTGIPISSQILVAEGRLLTNSRAALQALLEPDSCECLLLRMPTIDAKGTSLCKTFVAKLTMAGASWEPLLTVIDKQDNSVTWAAVLPEADNGVEDFEFSTSHPQLRFKTTEGFHYLDLEDMSLHLELDDPDAVIREVECSQ